MPTLQRCPLFSVLHREIPLYIHTGQLYMEDGIEVEKEDDEECITDHEDDTGTGKYIRQSASDEQFSGPVGIQSLGRLP